MRNRSAAGVLILFLCALPLILAACAEAGATTYSEPPLAVGAEHVRQYGQTDAVIMAQGDFSYVVLYPQTGIEALDEALCGWVQMTVDDAIGRKTMSDDGRLGGELMVSYDSYLAGGRFVSIVQTGSYVSRGTAPPVDIVFTANYDLAEQRILSAIELIPFASHPEMFRLVEQKLAEQNPGLDAHALSVNSLWLEPIVLTDSDVRLIISGDEQAGILAGELIFSYEELEGILFLPGSEPDSAPPDSGASVKIEDTATQPVVIDPEKPMIALSFDDGPSRITWSLLDLLERYNVPATFFIIGRQVSDYPETLERMADQGCELASHTWDHPELNRLSADAVAEQIIKTADAIEAAAGVRPELLRPPYGAANSTVREIAAELGVYLVNWSVDTLDWKTRSANAVYEHIMANARDGSIILCHDLYASTLEAMEMAIPELLEQGYQIVTVGQLLGLEQGNMVFGTVYRQK